jgi:uncharacterized membrane protein
MINYKIKLTSKKFLLLNFLILFMYCLIIPPFQIPDEPNHFYRVIQISKFNLVSNRNKKEIGGELESKWILFVILFIGDIPFHYDKKFNPNLYKSNLNQIEQNTSINWIDFRNTALYNFVPYLNSSIGVYLSGLITENILFIYFIGRFFNAIIFFFIVLAFYSFNWFNRKSFILLFNLPICLFFIPSYSADSFIICSSLLFFSIITSPLSRLSQNINYTMLIVSLILAGLLMSKQVYLVLSGVSFLFFFQWVKKNLNKQRYLYFITSILILLFGLISFVLWNKLAIELYEPMKPGIDPLKSKIWVESNFLEYINIFIFEFGKTFFKESMILQVFGSRLGWLDFGLNTIPFTLLLVMFCASIPLNGTFFSRIEKLYIFIIILIGIFAIYLSVYLSWNPPGNKFIEGIQGRYFFPFFLLLIFFRPSISKWLPYWIGRLLKSDNFRFGLILSSNLLTSYAIFLRYY